MYAAAHGDKVRLRWSIYDPETYLQPLMLLDEAQRALTANEGDLGRRDLAPYEEDVYAAEADVEDLFTEDYSIEHAERMYASLGAAILKAKISRGDYHYGGDDAA